MKKYYIPGPEEIAEKHYMVIPNIFYDIIMPVLDPYEWKILSLFIRKTYGFHKDRYSIGLIQICCDINISYGTVQKRIDNLVKAGILTITRKADHRRKITREYKLIQGDFYV